jgi:virginiamycin B lyase
VIVLLWAVGGVTHSLAVTITEFSIPTAGSNPNSITNGDDGALWFTEIVANQIGCITTAGVITEFAIPTANSLPSSIQ